MLLLYRTSPSGKQQCGRAFPFSLLTPSHAACVSAGSRPSLTGLEGSAPEGKGWGIEPLQRRARQSAQSVQSVQSVRIGASMQVDAALLAEAAPASPASASASGSGPAGPGVRLRPWSEAERRQGEAGAGSGRPGVGGLSGAFATTISQAYATFQAKAGRRVGVAPGAAWQAALRAAAATGAQQVRGQHRDGLGGTTESTCCRVRLRSTG